MPLSMIRPTASEYMTLDQYIALEQRTGIKHEYHDGMVRAMAGASEAHSTLGENFYYHSRSYFTEHKVPCRALGSERKLFLPKKNRYVYPDMMIVCGPIERAETVKGAILNPTVIVEVLSEGTATYDRHEKFGFYRQIPTLREYLLVSQDKMYVEIYYQHPNGMWQFLYCREPNDTLQLNGVDLAIKMQDLYFGVEIED